MAYEELECQLEKMTDDRIIPAISIAVGKMGEICYSKAFGKVYETNCLIDSKTRFDIASLTKILTGICFMKLVEEHRVSLNEPICKFFPRFDCVKPIERTGEVVGKYDCSQITWYHVLTHTSGMGWTRKKTLPSLPNLKNGLEDIYGLPLAYIPGEHIVYSDIPIILMGKAMEKISDLTLDILLYEYLCKPIGLNNTGYIRHSECGINKEITIPTEYDTILRKKRVWGEVHDENAYLMDGVSAHAGIFSTAEDMCKLAMIYNNCLQSDGILKKDTVKAMITEQKEECGDRRGLIWQLRGNGESAFTKLLSSKAYGHTGFTGCFLWVDPIKDLTVVFLSNDIYNGRENRKLFDYRERIMELVINGA